ncbi:MAG: S1C family serine protease [Actinobacteria bacterium]|nr:S1C family serine protease [Actinomycetota bacterium]
MTEWGQDVVEQTTTSTRRDPWPLILGILGGVLLGTGVTFAILGFVGVFEEPTPPTLPPAPLLTAPPPTGPPPTLGDTVTVAAIAERVIPSTVFIETSGFLTGASGSGVVYGTEGHIVTNNHVVEGASTISVVFADGARYPVQLVGTDPLTDLAVLRVEREDLTPIDIGSSTYLAIGEPAIAAGSPLGLDGGPTVTAGIVSALNRSLEVSGGDPLYGLVQTDAPIAPGSSGGALVDARGRLIGITTAIAVSDVGAEGLGFAVPVDIVVGVVDDLIRDGRVAHARLGIEGTTAWADRGDAEYPAGVGISGIPADSAYETSGGQVNDVIVEIAGIPVNTLDDLLAVLRRLRAGQTVPIRILRVEDEVTLDVVLGQLD